MRALFALVFCVQAYLVLGQCSNFNPCSTDQTCCSGQSSHKVGCCPASDAVCCSDGLHCCPSGTICDLSKGVCDNSSIFTLVFIKIKQLEMKLKSVSFKKPQNDRKVYCPGYQYFCPDSHLCCRHPDSSYSCCPYSTGICCQDGWHCCPYGSYCAASSLICLRADIPIAVASNISLAFLKIKEPDTKLNSVSFKKEKNDRTVYCPNRYYFCPDGQKCCRHPDGIYSCCPYSSGMCCRDGFHCCPYGSRCDASSLNCLRADIPIAIASNISLAFLKTKHPDTKLKSVSFKKEKNDRIVYCPNRYYFCPDGQKCCRHPDGQYSCCPYYWGMCCRDGFHCCPYGSRCDASSLNCLRAAFPMAVASKLLRTPAFSVF